MQRRIVAIALSTIMMLSMTSCSSNKNKDNTAEDSKQQQEEVLDNKEDETKSSLKIKKDMLKESITGHKFLGKSFTFEESHNQTIEKIETEGQQGQEKGIGYISENTWIYTGVLNDGITDMVIEGETAEYTASITYEANNEYPSNIGVTFTSSNDTDFDNMLSWAYQSIGEIVPPKLGKSFQNAGFKGLTEKGYTEDGIQADVYKENSKNEDGTVTATLNIIIDDGVEEVKYTDIEKFIIDKGSNLGIYTLNVFDYNSTISNMESRLSSLYSNKAKAVTEIVSTYKNNGIDRTKESVYAVFNIEIEDEKGKGESIETNITINSDEAQVTGDKLTNISITTSTALSDTVKEAKEKAKLIIDGILGEESNIDTSNEDKNNTIIIESTQSREGFPIEVKLDTIEKGGKQYCKIEIVTQGIEAKEEVKQENTIAEDAQAE